jgi:hypothetical protein
VALTERIANFKVSKGSKPSKSWKAGTIARGAAMKKEMSVKGPISQAWRGGFMGSVGGPEYSL